MVTNQEQPKQQVPRQKQHSPSMNELLQSMDELTRAVNRLVVQLNAPKKNKPRKKTGKADGEKPDKKGQTDKSATQDKAAQKKKGTSDTQPQDNAEMMKALNRIIAILEKKAPQSENAKPGSTAPANSPAAPVSKRSSLRQSAKPFFYAASPGAALLFDFLQKLVADRNTRTFKKSARRNGNRQAPVLLPAGNSSHPGSVPPPIHNSRQSMPVNDVAQQNIPQLFSRLVNCLSLLDKLQPALDNLAALADALPSLPSPVSKSKPRNASALDRYLNSVHDLLKGQLNPFDAGKNQTRTATPGFQSPAESVDSIANRVLRQFSSSLHQLLQNSSLPSRQIHPAPVNKLDSYLNNVRSQIHAQNAALSSPSSAAAFLQNYSTPKFKHPNKQIQRNRNDLAKSYARQTRLAGWYQEHDNKKGLKRANRLRSRFAKKLTRADANFMQRKHADDEIIRIAGAKGGKVMLSASAKQKISQNRNTTASLEDLYAQILLAQLEKLAKSNSKRKDRSKITPAVEESKVPKLHKRAKAQKKQTKEEEQSAKDAKKSRNRKDKQDTKKKPQQDKLDRKESDTNFLSRRSMRAPRDAKTEAPRREPGEAGQQLADTKAALKTTQDALSDMSAKVSDLAATAAAIATAAAQISKAAGTNLKNLKKQLKTMQTDIQNLWKEVDA